MNIRTYSHARANLKQVMDRVVDDKAPVVITRRDAEAVVMVSLSDWNALEETLHLTKSPAISARFKDAIAQLEAGRGVARTLRGA